MPIDKPEFRPPQDNMAPMLRLSYGCTHMKCRFCDLYTREKFQMVPMETVRADIDELAKTTPDYTRRLFLVGGNVMGLPTDHVLEALAYAKKRIPSLKEFGGFCRVADIKRKTDDELAALGAIGVNDISVGAESGWDPSLEFLQKGHTADDVIEQTQRLKRAGIDATLFYLAGSCGAGNGQENALASARTLSLANPRTILVVTLTPSLTWPLAEDIAEGRWTPPTETETAEEIRTLVANLDPAICTSKINASHDSNVIRFEGIMPTDQEKMVQLMDHMIPRINETAARKMRNFLHGVDYYGNFTRKVLPKEERPSVVY